MKIEDLEAVAGSMMVKVLEGSSLCCEIKTAELIFPMNPDKSVTIMATEFIGQLPSEVDLTKITFAYSIDPDDSSRSFGCESIDKHEIDIYYFNNRKVFCSQKAILDIRDPFGLCSY